MNIKCNAGNGDIMFVCCEDCVCTQCKNQDCHILHCYPESDVCVSTCPKYIPKIKK